MDKGYSTFLMAQLAIQHGVIDSNMEYDLIWVESQRLLEIFEKSEFNDVNEPLYDCINDYLASYKESIEPIKFYYTVMVDNDEEIKTVIIYRIENNKPINVTEFDIELCDNSEECVMNYLEENAYSESIKPIELIQL